jgi:hypothetical protein
MAPAFHGTSPSMASRLLWHLGERLTAFRTSHPSVGVLKDSIQYRRRLRHCSILHAGMSSASHSLVSKVAASSSIASSTPSVGAIQTRPCQSDDTGTAFGAVHIQKAVHIQVGLWQEVDTSSSSVELSGVGGESSSRTRQTEESNKDHSHRKESQQRIRCTDCGWKPREL